MNLEEEQQSAAEIAENAEASEELESGESASPEETEEQKKEAEAKEAAEKARIKEERKQASIQKRINELTAEKYEAFKRAELLAEQNAKILAMLEGKQGKPAQNEGEPKRENFEDYEEYVAARAEWRAEQKALAIVQKAQAEYKEELSRRERESAEQTAEKQFLERRNAIQKEYPDYQEVVTDWEPNIPSTVQDMIVKLPEGPKICYHLAKNPELEAQFREQPSYMHGVILGQIIASLKSPQKVSAAPPPGKPVTQKQGTATEPPSNPELYYAWAKKNLR